MDEQREQHSSYAQISASRVTCGGNGLACYGSKLRHNRYINITISESELIRSINTDRYLAHKQLISVRLTENQFAQFITSMNIGGGTPCTLDRLIMKAIPEPPFHDEVSTVKNEFKQKTDEVASTLNDA